MARRVDAEAKAKRIRDPNGLTLLAALFLPVTATLTYLILGVINHYVGRCSWIVERNAGYSYQYCSQPANALYVLIPVAVLVNILVLAYLYTRVKMPRPALRAIIVTSVVWLAFIAEGIGGAMLILTGVGGIVYICLIPILYGAVQRFYSQKVLHQTMFGTKTD